MADASDWRPCIEGIIASPGVVMVVGASDAGKTTFCVELANAAAEAEIPCAVVDADVGQSEIGPPGAIGLGIVEGPIVGMRDLRPRRLYFIGDVTPVGHLVQCVVGVRKLVDEATHRGAKLTIVDTTGLIRGAVGRKLKLYKIDVVGPQHLVAVQKNADAEHVLRAFRQREGMTIWRLRTSPEARTRSREMRASRRRLRLYEHFRMAEKHTLRLDDLDLWGTWLGAGTPLTWQEARTLEEALDLRVLHAERVGSGLYVVAGSHGRARISRAQESLNVGPIAIVPAARFEGILAGLADSTGSVLEVGIVKGMDLVERTITVLTPLRSAAPVRRVIFGSLRVGEDGSELGRLKAGEI